MSFSIVPISNIARTCRKPWSAWRPPSSGATIERSLSRSEPGQFSSAVLHQWAEAQASDVLRSTLFVAAYKTRHFADRTSSHAYRDCSSGTLDGRDERQNRSESNAVDGGAAA